MGRDNFSTHYFDIYQKFNINLNLIPPKINIKNKNGDI